MKPQTAQGILVNFKDLYYYNANKLPFAAAQIGQAFRNEIKFTLAESEHFVDPQDKSHPKYHQVADLKFLMFPRSAKRIPLRDAVSKVDGHYAADCWDAEIECSFGWIECVGIADRSAYDLRAHSDKSGVLQVAREKFSEPKEVEKELGLAFKGNPRMVVEAHEVEFQVCTLGKVVTIKKNMVTIQKKKNIEHERVFTRSVIESSFGIGRIIYCLFEHTFYTRQSKAGDQQLNVFRFSSLVAPIKCTVFPLVQNQKYEEVAKLTSKSLTAAGISHKIDTSTMWIKYKFSLICTSIGKRYARTDELDVPFAITVDSTSSVTIRERDSKGQVRVDVDKAASVVREVTEGQRTWEDVWSTSPHHSSTSASADD
uniref:Anticodon-binding domain-containing protein n=1 Tax=Glycine max TaxID=3847 RepID=A0A0R0FFI0_SOYBN